MNCYRGGGCGPYEMLSCSECPASKASYLKENRENEKKTDKKKTPCAKYSIGEFVRLNDNVIDKRSWSDPESWEDIRDVVLMITNVCMVEDVPIYTCRPEDGMGQYWLPEELLEFVY